MFCIYLQSMINTRVEWKLAAALYQDMSHLLMFNLIERFFNNVANETKSRHVFTRFLHTEIPLTCFKCHIGAVYFKKTSFFIKESYMWVGITTKPFSGFCHIHLLGYPLSQHLKFQKLPVSFVRWINVLILLKMWNR